MSDGRAVPRAHQRVDWRVPIEIVTALRTIEAETRNISVGGLLIATSAEVAFGTMVAVAFRLPTLSAVTRLHAIVRWTQPGAIGVQFVALRAVEIRAIHRLLRAPG